MYFVYIYTKKTFCVCACMCVCVYLGSSEHAHLKRERTVIKRDTYVITIFLILVNCHFTIPKAPLMAGWRRNVEACVLCDVSAC